jgi:hypothetical protein
LSALGPFEKEMLLRLDRIASALEMLATAANHGVIYTKCELTNDTIDVDTHDYDERASEEGQSK